MKTKKKQMAQSAVEAVAVAKELITEYRKEHFIALYLNARCKVIYKEVISIGSLDACLVHPREVFYPAIKKCAQRLILLHNHPSGEVSPSEADINLANRLKDAGKILGFEIADNIIFTKGEKYRCYC